MRVGLAEMSKITMGCTVKNVIGNITIKITLII